ncbi:hypothetical protein DASC09_039140 [Saccharomycopsis crataegensis]|uniref:Uncharacterized protein n=1 Tax=Saccharomycopsis crataegensis TaxID=43959 RepID=A0AAV5QPJ0_9ASCO|nr:hypothetical protein DASC09_039140 [Saccharomycopsis crataegensis]
MGGKSYVTLHYLSQNSESSIATVSENMRSGPMISSPKGKTTESLSSGRAPKAALTTVLDDNRSVF